MARGPEFDNTWFGGITQNDTATLSANDTLLLGATNVGFIPVYGRKTMVMTEIIGTGILGSLYACMMAQVYLRRVSGAGSTWITAAGVNGFCYTITTVMMGSVSGLFNPAVAFGWAILGRISWEHWIVLFCVQVAGAFAGIIAAWGCCAQQMQRVPIPRRGKDGNFLYMEMRFQLRWWRWRAGMAWSPQDRPHFLQRPPPKFLGPLWATPEYCPDDVDDAAPDTASDKALAHDRENGLNGVQGPPFEEADSGPWAGWSPAERALAATPEFQAELRRDQRAKLFCFAEMPMMYSPWFIYPFWAHMVAGVTLVHWMSFMTGNATQLTNTNMYLTQPSNGTPGSNYAFLNAAILGGLVGLAYFLLVASMSPICTMQLNPAIDIAGRLAHWLLPIPNKGYSGWSYAPMPIFSAFPAAAIGAGIMYMSMWSHMYMPFRPYGDMPHWF